MKENKMIAVVRISGNVKLDEEIKNTFNRLKIRKKYSCVVVKGNDINEGMIRKVRNFVAYGEINKETFEKLIESRGQLIDKTKKINGKKVVEDLEKGVGYEKLNLKPFFRLHPPRKGIASKKAFGVGKGVLGDNKNKINDLITRML